MDSGTPFLAQVAAVSPCPRSTIGVLVSSFDSGPISWREPALSPALPPVPLLFPPAKACWRDPGPGSLLAMSGAVEGPCYQPPALSAMFGSCGMSPLRLCWDLPRLLAPFPLVTPTHCCCSLVIKTSSAVHPSCFCAMLHDHFPSYLVKSSKAVST